ncbi:MAG: DUF192 domain-containing protein [Gaiellaceae bacterium]
MHLTLPRRRLDPLSRSGSVSLAREDGSLVCERCAVAATPLSRLRGLLGRSELQRGEGLLIRPCSSVHTWFMRFPIDVVFLDRELRVVRVARRLAPWRTAAGRKARAVLELPAGESDRRGLRPGDRLAVVEAVAR